MMSFRFGSLAIPTRYQPAYALNLLMPARGRAVIGRCRGVGVQAVFRAVTC